MQFIIWINFQPPASFYTLLAKFYLTRSAELTETEFTAVPCIAEEIYFISPTEISLEV